MQVYFKLTYLYMVLGIVTTGVGSVIGGVFFGSLLDKLFQSNIALLGLIAVQIALVFVVARLSESQNKAIALSGYLGFTVFEGLILSPVLLITNPKTLIAAFVSTAGLFGIMAILGYTTKIDMSRFGGILLAATFALFLAMIVNVFIGSGVFGYVFSIIAKIVLTLRTPPMVAQTIKNLSSMQETWVRSLGWEDPLEKGMAIYSSLLAWRILWTEEPGGPQSVELQRVGHN